MIRLHFIKPREVTIYVKREAVIGRENFNVIAKVDVGLVHDIGDDMTVSRNHARLYFENGKWYIQDLGSLNGTRIDKELIIGKNRSISRPIEIRSGSEIEIGMQTLFRVEFEFLEFEHCQLLKQIKDYLDKAIDYLNKARGQKSIGYLKDAFKILTEKIDEKSIKEVIEEINNEKLERIRYHISVIKSIKQVEDYLHSSGMLVGLVENLESIKSDIENKLENCTAT
ncbi:MAG: FHA domain-containing protein [Thermofilaceae archaeon]|nr:FHA domain-containing protein [Thermofilaceae archaeon]